MSGIIAAVGCETESQESAEFACRNKISKTRPRGSMGGGLSTNRVAVK